MVLTLKMTRDFVSIRSSPSYGLSTPCKLPIRNSARLFHHVLFNMGDLHLVLPAQHYIHAQPAVHFSSLSCQYCSHNLCIKDIPTPAFV